MGKDFRVSTFPKDLKFRYAKCYISHVSHKYSKNDMFFFLQKDIFAGVRY